MTVTNSDQRYEIVKSLIEQEDWEALSEVIEKLPTVEIVEILEKIDEEHQLVVFSLFSKKEKAQIFGELPADEQYYFFQHLDKRDFSKIFQDMRSDERADFYQDLSVGEQSALLPYLNKQVRSNVLELSGYEADSAGGIMTTDFATVRNWMTVRQAVDKIKLDSPGKKMIYYVYVVDNEKTLLGFVTLKDLILAELDDKIEDLVHVDFVAAQVDDDRENVAKMIEKYNLVALPIINIERKLLGIVRHDDAIDVIVQEQTEDMERLMGIQPSAEADEDEGYLDLSVFKHFKKRVVWLVSLGIMGMISGLILHHFEEALDKMVILALYMPMLADTGGNAGSQASTVVIRALSLGEVRSKDWWLITFKEMRISLLLAICLSTVACIKVFVLSYDAVLPGHLTLTYVAFIISLALALQVVSSTLIGAGLPLIVRKFGGDPAVVASPAITTIVDVTGLLIYFSLATAFLLN
ncbi:magnesium transporter [Flammeovirga yaeyamensis]|uniref:Magnesium transporter MgtE n=1 Tax=Flammeovirga yaeyamensis TaxID=367791 RepID=A0AAX1N443_9BACT|nr:MULTISPECIES: magnesium transporter [Flammeovirga]ANQ50356.1 magnesium transporter [Flammeovirga sp. MY04]MBB3699688.1 magnesium transporter [Flammeovirga yaeyamensis]NMF36742.1 magnesium transporter [Flammeovirga yaeyamensis]QWG02217.1 magnesium transporter [Flammeovirga yaeyamensis]